MPVKNNPPSEKASWPDSLPLPVGCTCCNYKKMNPYSATSPRFRNQCGARILHLTLFNDNSFQPYLEGRCQETVTLFCTTLCIFSECFVTNYNLESIPLKFHSHSVHPLSAQKQPILYNSLYRKSDLVHKPN